MNAFRVCGSLLLVFALIYSSEAAAQEADSPPEESEPDRVVIVGGHWFDTAEGRFLPNQGILVSNGRFLRVDTELEQQDFEETRFLELGEDQYILPGIVDVHAHYNMDLLGEGRVDETTYNPLIYLANGVTTTFPAGAYDPEKLLEARDRINSGEQVGPRLLHSGPYFGSTNPNWDEDTTEEEIYALVDEWAAKGAAGFKAKGASPEELDALIRRAHHHGLTVTGHLGSGYRNSTNARTAIDMGIDRVEHILGGHVLDPEEPAYPVWNEVDTTEADFRRTVQKFLDHQVHFTATITAPVYFGSPSETEGFDDWANEREFFTPYVQELWKERQAERTGSELMENLYLTMRRTTKAFYDAGGEELITLGTDKPSWGDYLPGFSAHREMHTMVLAGIPEATVLRIASINGARALNQGDLLGSIEVGKLADLYVVRGNPLEDITNTREVEVVMKAGEFYEPEALLEKARGRIGPAGPGDHAEWRR